jgi:hypothetical protein
MCIAVISPTLTATQSDAREGAAIVEIGDVGELASQAIQRFDYDDVEEAAIEIGQQLLIAGPETAGAAHRRVGVSGHRRPAALRDVAGGDLDLVGDRGGALVLAAEPGIDRGAHHQISLLRRFKEPRRAASMAWCRRDASRLRA